ncbi:MAG: hypothetical protein EI684_13360, partial [Candidatus Viridilinea halotolerans]
MYELQGNEFWLGMGYTLFWAFVLVLIGLPFALLHIYADWRDRRRGIVRPRPRPVPGGRIVDPSEWAELCEQAEREERAERAARERTTQEREISPHHALLAHAPPESAHAPRERASPPPPIAPLPPSPPITPIAHPTLVEGIPAPPNPQRLTPA